MEKLYTKKEVAEYLKVSVRTVTRMIKDMDIPVYYVGRQVRIPASSLNKMLNGPMSSEEQDRIINDLLEV